MSFATGRARPVSATCEVIAALAVRCAQGEGGGIVW